MSLNSYIVHIYSREEESGIIGVVEEVGGDGKKAFSSIDELWEILKPVKMLKMRGRNKAKK